MLFCGLAVAEDRNDGGLRINGELVIHTTAELVEHLKQAEPGSIRLLEFSGDGGRDWQSLDEFWDGHTENVLMIREGRWRLIDRNREQPDPDWEQHMKRALNPQAVVYFYGCQTGYYDHTGLVIEEMSVPSPALLARPSRWPPWAAPSSSTTRIAFPTSAASSSPTPPSRPRRARARWAGSGTCSRRVSGSGRSTLTG